MIEKLRITSKLRNTDFVAKTNIGGEWYVLTENFKMVTATEFENNPAYAGVSIFQIRFSDANRTWEMEYDTEDKPIIPHSRKAGEDDERFLHEQLKAANELNRNKRIAVKEFFSRCHQLEHASDFDNGFSPQGPVIATVELVTQKAKMRHLADRKKAYVFNVIDNMSWEDQYDLILYYAPEFAGKRRSEGLHGLIGLKDVGTERAHLGGKMWQKTGQAGLTFADDFLNNYHEKRSNTIVMKIYVEKAIALGIISRGNGGLYLNGSTYLGKDSTDAVIYLTKDMATYNNQIQAEVNKKGELPYDDLSEEPKIDLPLKTQFEKNKQNTMSSAEYVADFQRLREEYVKLGGSWPEKGMKYTELKERVEKQRAAVRAAEKMEELPTNQLEQAIDPTTTDNLKSLIEIGKELGVRGAVHFKSITALKEAIRAKQKEKGLAVME